MPTRETFEELYHEAPVGYFTTHLDDVIARVNRMFLVWTGYRDEEVVGRQFSSLLHPDDRQFYLTRRVPVLRLDGEVREVALRVVCADGSAMPVLLNSVVVLDESDTPRLIRGVIFDATARTEYEEELRTQRRLAESAAARVQVLQNASVEFAEASTQVELAEALRQIALDALGATVVAVATIDGQGELELIAGENPLDGLYERSDRRPGPDALRSGRPTILPGREEIATDYPVIASAMETAGLQGIAAFPLMRDHAPAGVVAGLFAERRELDPDTIALVEAIALQAAQALSRVRLQEELAHLALYDQLTGLANRALLHEHIDAVLSASSRSTLPIAMMFLDLDGFKRVNDRLGHTTGDAVLREVATRLRDVVRDGDVIGRLGGDEFIVLCPDTDDEQAEAIAERLREAVAQPMEWLPADFPVSVSVGVVVHPAGGPTRPTTDQLLEIADAEMYRAKNSGRNRVSIAGR